MQEASQAKWAAAKYVLILKVLRDHTRIRSLCDACAARGFLGLGTQTTDVNKCRPCDMHLLRKE